MHPVIPTILAEAHAQALVIHGVYLTEPERKDVEVHPPYFEGGEAILDVSRSGPGDEISWLIFVNRDGCLGAQDVDRHDILEVGWLPLPATSEGVRAYIAKSIRWLLSQDIEAIRRRRSLPVR